jgi:SNF2 family DNA or RNA helicase
MLTLKNHQQDNLDFFRSKARAISLLPYGAGKSAVAVLRMGDLVSKHRVLIVTTNGTVLNWMDEIKLWGRKDWKAVALIGKKQRRVDLFESPHNIAVINHEGLRVMLEAVGKKFANHYKVVFVDELHRAKNPETDVAKDLALVCHPDHAYYVYGLTGSPVLESPLDLFSLLRIINPFIFGTDFEAWRDKFFVKESIDESYPKWVPREGAVDFLRAKLHSISFRRERDEVDVLYPEQIFHRPIRMDLCGETRRRYDEAERNLSLSLNSGAISLVSIYPRLEKLCQLTRGWCYNKDKAPFYFPERPAIEATAEYLENVKGTGQIVIWAVRPPDMAMIGHLLDRMGIRFRYVFGKVRSLEKRKEVVSQFNNGLFDVLLAQPRCLGEGLSLQAKYSLRYSYRWSSLEWDQPIGRFARLSSRAKWVHYTDIVINDTIDVGIIKAVRQKLVVGESIKKSGFDFAKVIRDSGLIWKSPTGRTVSV